MYKTPTTEEVHHIFFFPEVPLNLGELNPFRDPEPLPILNPSDFVPKNGFGFPVVKGLRDLSEPQKLVWSKRRKKNC